MQFLYQAALDTGNVKINDVTILLCNVADQVYTPCEARVLWYLVPSP